MKKKPRIKKVDIFGRVIYRVTVNAQISANYSLQPGKTSHIEDCMIKNIQQVNDYAKKIGLEIWFDDAYFDIERDGIPTYAHPAEKKLKNK